MTENHVAILVERIQAEERERCARIADEYGRETLPVDPGAVARIIAGRIRDGGTSSKDGRSDVVAGRRRADTE